MLTNVRITLLAWWRCLSGKRVEKAVKGLGFFLPASVVVLDNLVAIFFLSSTFYPLPSNTPLRSRKSSPCMSLLLRLKSAKNNFSFSAANSETQLGCQLAQSMRPSQPCVPSLDTWHRRTCSSPAMPGGPEDRPRCLCAIPGSLKPTGPASPRGEIEAPTPTPSPLHLQSCENNTKQR